MVKVGWTARLAGTPEDTGKGRIVVPLRIEEDRGRPLELVIPASRLEAYIRQLEHALQSERTLQSWAKGGPAGRSGPSEVE